MPADFDDELIGGIGTDAPRGLSDELIGFPTGDVPDGVIDEDGASLLSEEQLRHVRSRLASETHLPEYGQMLGSSVDAGYVERRLHDIRGERTETVLAPGAPGGRTRMRQLLGAYVPMSRGAAGHAIGWAMLDGNDVSASDTFIDLAGRKAPLHGPDGFGRAYATVGYVPVDGDDRVIRVVRNRRGTVATFLGTVAVIVACVVVMDAIRGRTVAPDRAYVAPDDGEYAYFSSIGRQTWASGRVEQRLTISNPTYVTNPDGTQSKQPVKLAPHIYVDLDGNGEFSDDECVWNPVTYDRDGRITDYGSFLEPGDKVDEITLTRELGPGTYDARLEYTAVRRDTGELVSGKYYDFALTVR